MKEPEKQVGGNHYKKYPYQPLQFAADINLNVFQHNIIKYCVRYKDKNGKEDLLKAIHYSKLAIEMKPLCFIDKPNSGSVDAFIHRNKFPKLVADIIVLVVTQQYDLCALFIEDLIEQSYGKTM